MPAIGAIGILSSPYRHMRCAGTDFMVATRATVGLEGPRSGDGRHLVVMPVGARLDATKHQNSRNSSLSIPRIES